MTKAYLVLALSMMVVGSASGNLRVGGIKALFQEWMTEFGKEYHSAEEEWKRLEIWVQNHLFIERHNSNPSAKFTLGHNQFSDMTLDEFKAYNKLGEHSPGVLFEERSFVNRVPAKAAQRRSLKKIPDEVNWVEAGAV